MDKKSNNAGINKSMLRSLNKNYISEPIKDENKIVEIMSKFLNGEFDTIMSILESNEILNFKDSTGQTLVHAIIRNESQNITEENKLQIIKMLVNKNVSINSMTQLNQNPLHLASQKGYINIIIYLLSNGCDQRLNDNNGNAPIHYLLDKFIDSCKKDDLYKPSNKEIKSMNSGQIKKINDIIKKQNLNILIKLFEPITGEKSTSDISAPKQPVQTYSLVKDGQKIIDGLNKSIKYSTQNLLPLIYTIIENKISDIKKIFLDMTDSKENKLKKAKNIVLNAKEELKKIYKFNLDDNTTIWDNFIQNQKLKIISNKTNYSAKINENIQKISEILTYQHENIANIKNTYYTPYIDYVSSVNYITYFLESICTLNKKIPINGAINQEKYLLPTTYAFDLTNGNLNMTTSGKTIEQFHVGIATLVENNKQLDLVLLEGTTRENYGLLNVDFNDKQNIIDTIRNFNKVELKGKFLFKMDTIDKINDFKTLFSNNQLQIEERTLPFNPEDDDTLIYCKGFIKLPHPDSNFFDLDDEQNDKTKNKNIKLWTYGYYLPTKFDMLSNNGMIDKKIISSFYDAEFVKEELKQMQIKKNNKFMNDFIGDDIDKLYTFVKNTLKKIGGIDLSKVVEYYTKSLEESKQIMNLEVKNNNQLAVKMLSECIISNDFTKKAIALNIDFVIPTMTNLKLYILKILLYEIYMNEVNNHDFITEENKDGLFDKITKNNNIFHKIIHDNEIIKYIVSNDMLFDRINDNNIKNIITEIRNFNNDDNYNDVQLYRDICGIIEIVYSNNIKQELKNIVNVVKSKLNKLLDLYMAQYLFDKISNKINEINNNVKNIFVGIRDGIQNLIQQREENDTNIDLVIKIPVSIEKSITNIIISKINGVINTPLIIAPEIINSAHNLNDQNNILQTYTDLTNIFDTSRTLISSAINLIINLSNNEEEKKQIREILSNTIWELITLEPNYIGTTDVIANISKTIGSFGNKLITRKLIEEYLPNPNYLDNIEFDNAKRECMYFDDKTFYENNLFFKYTPIKNLIVYIDASIQNILWMLKFNIDENNFRKYICSFDLLYVKEFTKTLISIINNLVILEKYIFQINFTEYHELIENFDNLLLELKSKTQNDDTMNILRILYHIKEFHKAKLEQSMREIASKKITLDIIKIYDEIIKIFGIFSELVENINKYQAEFQLEQYNEYVEKYINNTTPHEIKFTNTLFNNYSYDIKKKFPDNFELYKKKYFDINDEVKMYELQNNSIDKIFKFSNYPNILIQDVIPCTSTYDFNIFFSDMENIDEYDFNNFSLNNINGDNFANSDEFKFARGYDINNKIITYNDIKNNSIILKDDKYILTNIGFVKNYSLIDDTTNKVEGDKGLVAKFCIGDELTIDRVDFCTYLLTNNLNEIVNLYMYIIYHKITKDPELNGIFFSKSDNYKLNMYDNITNIIVETNILTGIDLTDYSIDDKYKTNIFDTLQFIKSNEKEKMNYILDNIKMFVKVILSTQIDNQINKILKHIKINPTDDDIIKINQSDTDIFNKNILEIISGQDQVGKAITNIIENIPSSTLEYNQLLRLMNNTSNNENSRKLFDNKCTNYKMTNELLDIAFDYKVLDLNGNTILNRLIDQYNIYAIEKIIKTKSFLKTYKNNNNETPIEYLLNQMANIQQEYMENNFEQRIKKYSMVIKNLIESNESFENISLENSENLVKEIITNSIYLFNEVMWLKLYEFPTGWELSDKKKIKEILHIKKEELLIKTFNFDDKPIETVGETVPETGPESVPESNPKSDIEEFKQNEKLTLENKINFYTKKLEGEINDYENKIKQYESDGSDLLISQEDISGNISEFNKLKDSKNNIKNKYDEYIKNLDKMIANSIENVRKVLTNNTYKEQKLITSTNINWNKYEQMIKELDSNYFKIIKILNGKIKNKSTISNFLLNIIKYKLGNSNLDSNLDLNPINKYFDKIFDNAFGDYWDLDRYEDSSYNVLNESIIGILKVNVIGIISNELFKTLINYLVQKNIYTDSIQNNIKKIKELPIGSNSIEDSIRQYLYVSMVTKIGQKNPDKTTYIDPDTLKKIILGEFNSIVGNIFDPEDLVILDKILEFNKFLCENISYNCYQEIIKILYDSKKISIQYKIYNLLK